MSKIKIFGLGGLSESGKNSYVVEVDNDIFVFDAGIKFASGNLLGIDYIVPDFSYLVKNRKRIKGLFVTHGHKENMGAVKDLVQDIPELKIYATKYTRFELIEDGVNSDNIILIKPHKKIPFGEVSIFPIAVSHSAPDSVMFVINTKDGAIAYTGDFIIDPSMSGAYDMDLGKIAYVGKQGVLCLLSESSFAEKDALLQAEIVLQTAEKTYQKAYEKYRAMLKEKSVSDMAARAMLAFSELKQNLYAKYISQVEDAFSQNFHSLISKTDLIDGIYIDSAFEVVAYKMQEVDIAYIFKEVQEYGEEYVFTNIGERAYKIIKESSFSDGKITVPIKVEQHFSAGEQQIFVMSLYQSLAEIRTSEIPFVIDTPLARIDSEHRRNILDHFFSRLPGQVIILSTDEEINNEGIAVLSSKISDVYLIEHQEDGTTSVSRGAYFKGVID